MPRVKIARDNRADSSKDITTRSKAKIKSKEEFSSSPVLKKRKISKAVPQTKSMVSKKQPKDEGTDEDEHNENLRQNKSNKNSSKTSIRTDKFNNNEKVEQKPNQNKKIIIIDDNSKDSNDDKDYDSEDEYEPDTDDEEEYRSRSHFW